MPERAAPAGLLTDFREVVGEPNVISDSDLLARYERDWTGAWHGCSLLAARPSSADEVAALLRVCARHGVGAVVQGGNTGLVGGATPLDGEVVLDTERLDEVGEVDRQAQQITVGAGVTLEAAQRKVFSDGFDVAVDLAARSKATIGGMVATDAGGALALRYGTMRDSVAGLEAVLPNGGIVSRLAGLLKDNAGYDLPSLLVGSEGTLGVVTQVRLRLFRRPARQAVALIGTARYEQAVDLVSTLRSELGPGLEAADCFDRLGLELVCAHLRLQDPLPDRHQVYLLVQVADDDDAIGLLAGVIDEETSGRIAVADETDRRRALWAYREGLNEAVGAEGVPRKYDISVPVGAIPAFATAAQGELAAIGEGARSVIYGHLGDGNLHLNVLHAPNPELLDESLAALVAAHDGSISAEHGIGRAKRAWLHPTRSVAEIEAMQAIKDALDPSAVLGRERVLPRRATHSELANQDVPSFHIDQESPLHGAGAR